MNLEGSEDEAAKNDPPDISARCAERACTEREHPHTILGAGSEIAAAGYDLSLNRYKEVVHEADEHRPQKDIIAELKARGWH